MMLRALHFSRSTFFIMFSFALLGTSAKYTLKAVDVNGKIIPYATLEVKPKANNGNATLITDEEFKPKQIKSFQLIHDDGSIITAPAPQSTKSLEFKLFMVDQDPVSLEVASTYRRSRVHLTVQRGRGFSAPLLSPPQEVGGTGGGMGLFPMILMGIIGMNLMTRFCAK